MFQSWRSSKARTFLGVIQLITFLSSCTSWQVQPGASPNDLVTAQRPYTVRITQGDGSRVVLNDPSVQSDTLYGAPDTSHAAGAPERIGVPLSNVKEIEVRRPDPSRTTLLFVGIGVTLLSAFCLAESLICEPEKTFLFD